MGGGNGPGRGIWAVWFLIAVVLLQGCSTPERNAAEPTATEGGTPTDTQEPPKREEPPPGAGKKFDRSNLAELATDADGFKGASVDIVGKVFGEIEQLEGAVAWQMWGDPKNSEFNMSVLFSKPGFTLKDDDYVHVIGTVVGSFEGENAFGGTVSAIGVRAETVQVVDAVAAGPPALRTATPRSTQTQHGIAITLDKVEFADSETRVFITIANGSGKNASFYSHGVKAQQGSSQFEAESFSDYADIPSDLLPGSRVSGVLPFPKMAPDQPVKFFLEAGSDDYQLDFTPYVFQV